MPKGKRRRTIKEDGPDPIDVYIGARVKARRKFLRINQTKLGEACGVTFQQVRKYEYGTTRIGASNLLKIAKALGVEVPYFFDGVEAAVTVDASPQAEVPVEDPMADTKATNLARDYFRIKDEGVRKRISQLLKVLAKAEAPE